MANNFDMLARGQQSFGSYKDGYKVGAGLTLVDPISQIARRIMAFFKDDKEVVCAFKINNNADIADPTYDAQGHIIAPGQDHLAELAIYVQCGDDVEDTQKADCISNWIRHRHVFPEYTYDGGPLIRNHILNVRVFAVGAIDQNDPTQRDRISECAFITDEAQQSGKASEEKWNQKYEQLKIAFKGNPNVARMFEYTTITGSKWRFIECGRKPVVVQEDSLLNFYGYTSILPVDILTLAFVFDGEFQIGTAVNQYEL